MNRHFEDARYYLGRTVETAAEGVREELEPVEERARELLGRETEPERGRLAGVREDVRDLERSVADEVKANIGRAREQVGSRRSTQ